MDAFSEILCGLKFSGALYFHAEFSVPWSVAAPPSIELAPALAPGASHLVIYHYIVDGPAVATLAGGQSIALDAGEVVIFPHGHPHSMSSGSVAGKTIDYAAVANKVLNKDLSPLRGGGGGQPTRFVCGFMACDPHLGRPVLGGLPPIFKVNVRSDPAGQWLENSVLRLVDEAASGAAGSDAMLAKLSEALFVDTLRRYVAALPEQNTGWLGGALDPVVGKSLSLLHSRVADPWTIATLAKEVGLSRSTLAERFTRYISEPPMTYLARWRLQLAARSLTTSPKSVAEIAAKVGYESEAAFHRAFKREFGLPPARYRREQKPQLPVV